MRPDLRQLERELLPLLDVHGVELVALEWFFGAGQGILRITLDNPGGDPRIQDPARSLNLDQVSRCTRDISSTLDALDLITAAYTLEIGSPGSERPLQKRVDYDRFQGLKARIEVRDPETQSRRAFNGILLGTVDAPETAAHGTSETAGAHDADESTGAAADGATDEHDAPDEIDASEASDATGAETAFLVRVDVGKRVYEIPSERIHRAKLHAIAPPPRAEKPGKGGSRRQERLAERERAREINAAHRAASATHGTNRQVTDGGGNTAVSSRPAGDTTEADSSAANARKGKR